MHIFLVVESGSPIGNMLCSSLCEFLHLSKAIPLKDLFMRSVFTGYCLWKGRNDIVFLSKSFTVERKKQSWNHTAYDTVATESGCLSYPLRGLSGEPLWVTFLLCVWRGKQGKAALPPDLCGQMEQTFIKGFPCSTQKV